MYLTVLYTDFNLVNNKNPLFHFLLSAILMHINRFKIFLERKFKFFYVTIYKIK